jgi:1,4-alpha-glucan branching enzyme
VTNSVGNSLVLDPSFDWGDDDQFTMSAHNEFVIYEMHIGTFRRKKGGVPGTFLTAIKGLDFLKWLGVNAMEVMPPFEFAGDLSWGYNPAHPFAIETAYGGPKAFKTFVKEAHKRGIAVILDVVYNHFGPSDLDLWQFDGWSENGKGGIYFYNDWRSQTPWGDTRPDYGRPEVRRYLLDNALMWLSEYRCDGLRMDMVPYIRNVHANGNLGDNIMEGYSVVREINDAIRHHFPHKITIAEDMHTLSDITEDTTMGGFGYSSQWDAQFVHPMQEALKIADDDQRDMLKVEQAFLHR